MFNTANITSSRVLKHSLQIILMVLLAKATITASSSSSVSAEARPPASRPTAATRTAALSYALNKSKSVPHGGSSFEDLFASLPYYNLLAQPKQELWASAINGPQRKSEGLSSGRVQTLFEQHRRGLLQVSGAPQQASSVEATAGPAGATAVGNVTSTEGLQQQVADHCNKDIVVIRLVLSCLWISFGALIILGSLSHLITWKFIDPWWQRRKARNAAAAAVGAGSTLLSRQGSSLTSPLVHVIRSCLNFIARHKSKAHAMAFLADFGFDVYTMVKVSSLKSRFWIYMVLSIVGQYFFCLMLSMPAVFAAWGVFDIIHLRRAKSSASHPILRMFMLAAAWLLLAVVFLPVSWAVLLLDLAMLGYLLGLHIPASLAARVDLQAYASLRFVGEGILEAVPSALYATAVINEQLILDGKIDKVAVALFMLSLLSSMGRIASEVARLAAATRALGSWFFMAAVVDYCEKIDATAYGSAWGGGLAAAGALLPVIADPAAAAAGATAAAKATAAAGGAAAGAAAGGGAEAATAAAAAALASVSTPGWRLVAGLGPSKQNTSAAGMRIARGAWTTAAAAPPIEAIPSDLIEVPDVGHSEWEQARGRSLRRSLGFKVISPVSRELPKGTSNAVGISAVMPVAATPTTAAVVGSATAAAFDRPLLLTVATSLARKAVLGLELVGSSDASEEGEDNSGADSGGAVSNQCCCVGVTCFHVYVWWWTGVVAAGIAVICFFICTAGNDPGRIWLSHDAQGSSLANTVELFGKFLRGENLCLKLAA